MYKLNFLSGGPLFANAVQAQHGLDLSPRPHGRVIRGIVVVLGTDRNRYRVLVSSNITTREAPIGET